MLVIIIKRHFIGSHFLTVYLIDVYSPIMEQNTHCVFWMVYYWYHEGSIALESLLVYYLFVLLLVLLIYFAENKFEWVYRIMLCAIMYYIPFCWFWTDLSIVWNGLFLQILFQFGNIILLYKFLNFISGPFGKAFFLFYIFYRKHEFAINFIDFFKLRVYCDILSTWVGKVHKFTTICSYTYLSLIDIIEIDKFSIEQII